MYSSFRGTSEDQIIEYEFVRRSWRDARNVAKSKGLEIEYVDVMLPNDAKNIPPNDAKEVILQRSAKTIGFTSVGYQVPVVSDLFKAGIEHGTGKWLIYTNSDIALVPDFYVKVWEFLEQDFLSNEAQDKQRNRVMEYKRFCLDRQGCSEYVLCNEDAKVVFENMGGIPAIYEKVANDVAMLLLQQQIMQTAPNWLCDKPSRLSLRGLCTVAAELLQKSGLQFSDVAAKRKQMLVNMYKILYGDPEVIPNLESLIDKWKNGAPILKPAAFSPQTHGLPEGETVPRSALTITRLEVAFEKYKDLRGTDMLRQLQMHGALHPGNDCFVALREHIPEELLKMPHPVGLRPWGMWVPDTFNWQKGTAWRRIASTKHDPWTFHLGFGVWRFGGHRDIWATYASRETEMVLFFTSSWFNVTRGKFAELFNVPDYCNNVIYWRDPSCKKGQTVNCRGTARYACSQFQHRKQRDILVYFKSCISYGASRPQGMPEPICGFCNFLRVNQKSSVAEFKCSTDDVSSKYIRPE